MKKLILAALAVGTVATANAQKPGSILLYGNIGVSAKSTTIDDNKVGTTDVKNKNINFHLMPGVGYQFNKNWTVGMNLGLALGKESTEPATDETRTRFLHVGPFVRMTMPINKTFFLFHQVNLGYMNGKEVLDFPSPAPNNEWNTNGFYANLIPAVGVNFTHCLALNFSFGGLGYIWSKEEGPDRSGSLPGVIETTNSRFDFTWGRQFNIGVSANLGGKRYKGHVEPGMDRRRHHYYEDDEDEYEIKIKEDKVKIERD